jgi:hypothetical protein
MSDQCNAHPNYFLKICVFALLIAASACSQINTQPSVALEEKSAQDNWTLSQRRLKLESLHLKREGGTLLVTAALKHNLLFSDDQIIIKAKILRHLIISDPYCSEVTVIGRLGGELIEPRDVRCSSLTYMRRENSRILFGGTFDTGRFRMTISPALVRDDRSLENQELITDGDRIPRDWYLNEMLDGAFLTGDREPTLRQRAETARVLTWKIWEGDNRLAIEECILWIKCDDPKRGWVLAHIARLPDGEDRWSQAWASSRPSFWIKYFDHPPNSGEVYEFLTANDMSTEIGNKHGYHIVDEQFCTNTWKRVVGETPKQKPDGH